MSSDCLTIHTTFEYASLGASIVRHRGSEASRSFSSVEPLQCATSQRLGQQSPAMQLKTACNPGLSSRSPKRGVYSGRRLALSSHGSRRVPPRVAKPGMPPCRVEGCKCLCWLDPGKMGAPRPNAPRCSVQLHRSAAAKAEIVWNCQCDGTLMLNR